ncbi:ATP synthase protein I [Fodinibius salinus]|uniref:ATP synthase protein I n=1 Tax=Fodinibius salinus TaxID=860790 RepID=A0A5D3YM83_9BACT|nr:AtpZ/AtpI family protein [Fodinibius salinus]TYP95010.1 ATP synthase protein I [Fodinibius salinus]
MNDQKSSTDYLKYLSLGLEIAVGLTLPIFVGYFLDLYFESSPWLLLVGCMVGIVNIFLLIFRINNRLNSE